MHQKYLKFMKLPICFNLHAICVLCYFDINIQIENLYFAIPYSVRKLGNEQRAITHAQYDIYLSTMSSIQRRQ